MHHTSRTWYLVITLAFAAITAPLSLEYHFPSTGNLMGALVVIATLILGVSDYQLDRRLTDIVTPAAQMSIWAVFAGVVTAIAYWVSAIAFAMIRHSDLPLWGFWAITTGLAATLALHMWAWVRYYRRERPVRSQPTGTVRSLC
jgi:drug/metabolite transporter (DMT)-like permease